MSVTKTKEDKDKRENARQVVDAAYKALGATSRDYKEFFRALVNLLASECVPLSKSLRFEYKDIIICNGKQRFHWQSTLERHEVPFLLPWLSPSFSLLSSPCRPCDPNPLLSLLFIIFLHPKPLLRSVALSSKLCPHLVFSLALLPHAFQTSL